MAFRFTPTTNKFAYLDDRDVAYVMHALRVLPRKVAQKHLRIGLNAWGGQVSNLLKIVAPKETGLLRKSFGVKVKIPDTSYNVAHHGRPAYCLVGPRRHTGRMLRRTARGRLVGFSLAQKELRVQRTAAGVKALRPLARERAAVRLTKSLMPGSYYRNPSRYAHLAERKRGYMKRVEHVGRRLGQTAFVHKVQQGIAQEATALASSQP
jgi:hypothetical protein